MPKRAVTPVCGKEDISVDASLPAGSWPAGAPHQFTMVVHNQANNPCTVDAGPSRHEFRIERDHRVIWSSTHCDPPQGTGMVTMSADEKRGYTLVWSGTTSQPGCAGQRTKLDKGTYGLIVRLGTETSDRREFTLT